MTRGSPGETPEPRRRSQRQQLRRLFWSIALVIGVLLLVLVVFFFVRSPLEPPPGPPAVEEPPNAQLANPEDLGSRGNRTAGAPPPVRTGSIAADRPRSRYLPPGSYSRRQIGLG